MREIKKSFWDFIVVSGSTVFVIPLMLVSEIIQTRYLGVENYGKVTLFYSAISFLFLISISWLTSSIVRFGKEEFIKDGSIRKTTGTFSVLAFGTLLLMSIGFFISRKPILSFLEVQHKYAFLLILFGVIIQIFKIYTLETLKTLRLIKIQTVLERLGIKLFVSAAALFPILFALDWISVNYMITVFLAADLAITLVGMAFIKRKYIFPLIFDRKQIKTVLLFCAPLFFAAWSNYIINYVDTYTIKAYMTLTDVGLYTASYKIYGALMSFVGAITAITIPMVIAMKAGNHENKIQMYLKRLVPQATFFGFILVSIILVSSDIVFHLVYGTQFEASIAPFKILSTSLLFTLISAMLTGFYLAYDMTKLISILGITMGLLNLVADILLIPYFGIIGPSMASLFICAASPIIWFFVIYRKFNVKRYLPLLFCFLIFIVLAINLLPISYYLRLIATILMIIITTISVRYFNLFNVKDMELLNNVSIPNKVRLFIEKVIFVLSKK